VCVCIPFLALFDSALYGSVSSQTFGFHQSRPIYLALGVAREFIFSKNNIVCQSRGPRHAIKPESDAKPGRTLLKSSINSRTILYLRRHTLGHRSVVAVDRYVEPLPFPSRKGHLEASSGLVASSARKPSIWQSSHMEAPDIQSTERVRRSVCMGLLLVITVSASSRRCNMGLRLA